MRQEIKKDTEMGKSARTYMEKGDIVPDEIAIRLIERQIRKHPDANGFIFKGFPRTIVQAYILDGLLRKLGSIVTTSINLDVSTLESIKRLTYRGKTQGKRLYDDTDIIIHRLEQFEKRSIKVYNYYSKQNKIEMVDGFGNEEDVFKRLTDVINKSFKKIR
jgi:adenylate kinase